MAQLGVWIAQLLELLVKMGVGCFVLIVVSLVALGAISSLHTGGSGYHPTAAGPRQPIPTVNSATLVAGGKVYKAQGCSNCHGNIGSGPQDNSTPDLTHEGQRNASIEWQIRNLKEHDRVFRPSSMPNYADLPSDQLRALASYMATRR